MKNHTQALFIVFFAMALLSPAKGQTITNQYYNVSSGNGNGLRFWSSNNYKIHMGNSSYYKYGPVQDYSIKMTMNNDSDRGWTWGVLNRKPTAALNTQGTFQLAKDLKVLGKVGIGTDSPNQACHIYFPYGSGTLNQIFFGDNNTYERAFDRGGLNCMVGEYGETDTDILQLHGKYGLKFTTGNFQNGNHSVGFELKPSSLIVNKKLHVDGNIETNGFSLNKTFGDYSSNPEDNNPLTIRRIYSDREAYHVFIQDNTLHHVYDNDETNSSIEFRLRNTDVEQGGGARASDRVVMAIMSGQNYGKVKVNGALIAEEVKVELLSTESMNLDGTLAANNITLASNGHTADFVFEESYHLRDLKQIENFIKEYKHLPDIPSAKEMEASGVNLAEMNKLLLMKIEELTLYAIEKEKKIEELELQLHEQTNDFKGIQDRVAQIEQILKP